MGHMNFFGSVAQKCEGPRPGPLKYQAVASPYLQLPGRYLPGTVVMVEPPPPHTHVTTPELVTVPTNASKIFTTSRDNQTAVKVLVMQGESLDAAKNELLGEFILTGLRRAPRGEVEIEVTFEINTDGIVEAEAKDLETGRAQSIEVRASGGLLEPELELLHRGRYHEHEQVLRIASPQLTGSLGVDEFQGGTFSISNLGMFGVDQFDAIINLPQAAILAVAAGVRKPVVRGDSIVAATVMRVSLSADHRAIDGAVAAQFLQSLKGFLENPASMLL